MIAKLAAWETQYRLYQNLWKSWKWAAPNMYMWFWESDIIVISKANYITEYEIKVSVSDYKRDNTKKKHYYLAHGYGPNRFMYALPVDLKYKIQDIPIPDHAGLCLVYKNKIEIIKRAPLLHKTKANDTQMKKIYKSNHRKAWKAMNIIAKEKINELHRN